MVDFAFKAARPKTELTAEEEYQDLTAQIVKLTDASALLDKDGELLDRKTRENNFRASIKLIDDRLDLGFDRTETEMLTLVYTALSEAPRFSGNDHLEPGKGGNTGEHSIHVPLRANLVIGRALEQLGIDDNPEAVRLRKASGLALMLHDFGESLGEPGTLEQESKNANFQKDKPAAERLIMDGIMRYAADAVASGDYEAFYTRLDEMKIPDTSAQAQVDSNEEFLARVQERLGDLPQLSVENEARVTLFRQFWDMQEKGTTLPAALQDAGLTPEFIKNLCGMSEHVQGSAYLVEMMTREADSVPLEVSAPWERVRSDYQVRGQKYNEGEVGKLFEAARTPLEHAIAIEAKKEAYEKNIDMLELGAGAIDLTDERVNELSAKDPNRVAEIEALRQKSEDIGAEMAAEGRAHEMRPIETRERLVAMYRWAQENDDFIPAAGQALIIDPPAEYRFEEPSKSFAAQVKTQRAEPAKEGRAA